MPFFIFCYFIFLRQKLSAYTHWKIQIKIPKTPILGKTSLISEKTFSQLPQEYQKKETTINKVICNGSSTEVSLRQTIILISSAARAQTSPLSNIITDTLCSAKLNWLHQSDFHISEETIKQKHTDVRQKLLLFFHSSIWLNTYCQDFIKKRNSSFIILLLVGR